MNTKTDTNCKPQKRERVVWIDILRGAMMFFVVAGHSIPSGDLKQWIFSFHMPIFFIISGMTFAFNKETDPLKYLLKKVKGLLVPYFLLNLYVTPLYYLNVHLGELEYFTPSELLKGMLISNVDSHYKMPSNTTWFITCLFVTELIFFALHRISKSEPVLCGLTILTVSTFYALGFLQQKGGGVWHWQTAFTALIFYLLGYMLMKHISEIKSAAQSSLIKTLLLCALLFADGYMLNVQNHMVSMVQDKYKNTLFFFLSASATSVAFILVVMLLSEYKFFLKLAVPINFIGKTTLAYIAFHVPLIRLVKHFVPNERTLVRLAIAAAIYIGFIPFAWLITKLIPFGSKAKAAKEK